MCVYIDAMLIPLRVDNMSIKVIWTPLTFTLNSQKLAYRSASWLPLANMSQCGVIHVTVALAAR